MKALEMQRLEFERRKQVRIKERERNEMLAQKNQNAKHRQIINQAFDEYRDYIDDQVNVLGQQTISTNDLIVSEDSKSDYPSYMDMPGQIHSNCKKTRPRSRESSHSPQPRQMVQEPEPMSERDNQYIKIVSQGSASGQPPSDPNSEVNPNRKKLARTNSYNGEHLRQGNERPNRRNPHHSGSPHNAQDMKGPQLQPNDHQRQYTFNNSNAMYQNQRFGSSSDSRGRSEAFNPRCESRVFGSSQYTRTFSKTVNEIEDTIYRDYHKQSIENISPNVMQAEDPDVEFVQFLKSIQLYVQQPNSPKSKKGDYYYENL